MNTKGLLTGDAPTQKEPLLTGVNRRPKPKKGLVPKGTTVVSTGKVQKPKGLLG